MSYRQAKPQEIADCIKRQVVDACDLAETDAYKNKPAKLRGLIRDIRIGANSNAQWVASQRWSANQGDVVAGLLVACEAVAKANEWSDTSERLTRTEQADILRAAIAAATGN